MSGRSDKIYVISCSRDLVGMGVDRIRTATEGLSTVSLQLDWSKAQLAPVVSAQREAFKAGETRIVSIRPITVPKHSVVIQSFYGANGMGDLFCIGSPEFKTAAEDRVADHAMFQSRIKASVMIDDLLGQVLIVPGTA